jgi:ribosomal protein S18 acetylase RimI-like enzyme
LPLDVANITIQPLRKEHKRGAFLCSNSTIQNYCRNNARRDHDAYKVRVYVACDGDSLEVLGYYYLCLTSYKVGKLGDHADSKFARVDAVPAVYLGMVGVHSDFARQGIGKLLMRDAMFRVAHIADLAGTYALTLDALDEDLVVYYRDQFGFQSFNEGNGLEMFLPLLTIKAALTG